MSKIILVLLFLSSCALANQGDAVNPSDYEDLVEEGTKAIEEGDFEKALKLSLPYAKAGNADAQFTVGLILGWGYGHEIKNPSEKQREARAFAWYEKAASSGHEEATQIMVDTYKYGWYGQKPDSELSSYWSEVLKQKKSIECRKR